MVRPKKTTHSPDYRASICAAGQALFAERGFAGTTIREIATQAGVNSGLLYHYYANKETLYLSLLETAVSEIVVQVEHIAVSPDSPEEKIRQIVHAFLAYYQAHPQSFLLIQRAVNEHSPAAQALAQHWFSRCLTAIDAVTTAGVQHGLFRPLPPPLLSFAIEGLLEHAVHIHKFIGNISPDLTGASLLDELANLILTLLRTDTPKRSVPVRRGKKQLPGKKPKSRSH
jgi:AcrR family transcriptional regulator